MSVPPAEPGLRPGDFALLGFYSFVLFGYSLVGGRVLTGHEAVVPQNAREMLADHDWLIPKCGSYPWLERPPLPDWILVGIATLFGRCDRDWIVRLGPVLMATCVVVLLAWLAAAWYGRTRGLLSGLILATMYEFFVFASDPEGDIFLCAIVTAALAMFSYLEFKRRPENLTENNRFLGGRPWPVLAFFVLLGMTNLAKGLIFGTLMAVVPVVGFLVWNHDLKVMRRYVWLWGWLAFAGVSLAWPLAAYQRYPGIVEVWRSDYLGRLNQSFIAEPSWYYLTVLPWILLPWTFPAFVGLWQTRFPAFRQRYGPERFLWTWALLTPAAFSIPDGKHHHYLLQCMAPWAVLAALGAVRLWQGILQWPAWRRNPVLGLLTFGIPGIVALVVFHAKISGPGWLVPGLMIGWAVLVFGICWTVSRPNGRLALTGLFSILAVFYCLGYAYQTRFLDRYREDTSFLEEVRHQLAPGQRLFLTFDSVYPLETFHLLFYTDDRTVLLHNLTFLVDQRIREKEVYILTRFKEGAGLASYGSYEVVLQSQYTRNERSPADRRTLFRLHFKDPIERRSTDVPITPMQAIHRQDGPFLH